MKITVVFDSLEEFRQHMTTGREVTEITSGGIVVAPAQVLPEKPQEPAGTTEAPKTEKKPKEQEKEPEPVEELPFKEDLKPAEKPAPKAPRVEDVRKALAALNKKAGKNVAKELIASVGYKKLTEVPEGALVTLQSLIEEEEKNYA